jgi:preprotein translocase SecE subunit
MKKTSRAFFTDVVKEVNKVTWPKRNEPRDVTMMVIVVCLLISLFVRGIDPLVSASLGILYKGVG